MRYEIWLDEDEGRYWLISSHSIRYDVVTAGKRSSFISESRNECFKWLEERGLKQGDYNEIYL